MEQGSASVAFEVLGLPAPQGSKSAYVRGGRAVVVDGSSRSGRERHARWRADVTDAARRARTLIGGGSFAGPVEVSVTFYFAPVKSDAYRTRHFVAPDIDKLVRSVLDSLTNSGLIHDDSLVFSLSAKKFYAQEVRGFVGASVVVADWSGVEAEDREALKAQRRESRRAHRSPLGGAPSA